MEAVCSSEIPETLLLHGEEV